MGPSTPTRRTSSTRRWRAWLVDLPRLPKRILLVTNDVILFAGALWLAFSFRLNTPFVPPDLDYVLLCAAAPAIGVATFWRLGLYRLVTRYIGQKGTVRLLVGTSLSVLLWSLLVFMSGVHGGQPGFPRSVVLLYGLLAAGFLWASRQLASWILKGAPHATPVTIATERRRVAIWGAGPAGVELLEALRRSKEARPVGFVDENPSLWGQNLGGIKVYRPEKIEKLIERDGVKEVLLALPETRRRERRAIIRRLERLPVRVKTLPAIEDIATGRVTVSDLRPIDVEDLLGRDPIPPNASLLQRNIRGKSVLITGAGGSIGSELCRQIVRQGPRRLVLFDSSEAALYQIDYEVRELVAAQAPRPLPEIVTVLGSVLDGVHVRSVLEANEVETIYHAAAYKHVPIVEANPIAGIRNNTFGTAVVAEAAKLYGVERMVLISTDKAVRPTNIMGASKRLAELVLQAHALSPRPPTVFTMVRFGNVLDSSGSVVRLFRKQIEAGGPVTVTHPEVIRYFMSIPEAAELVIQAGAMARGGEVFVLDMGEQVRIDDLARSMIRLMGRDVLDAEHPDGDIAIEYIGLRPGEKLYEELLIGESTSTTEHPRILRHHEPHLEPAELERELAALKAAITAEDVEAIRAVLMRTVEGYLTDRQVIGGETGEALEPARVSRTIH